MIFESRNQKIWDTPETIIFQRTTGNIRREARAEQLQEQRPRSCPCRVGGAREQGRCVGEVGVFSMNRNTRTT